MISRAEYQDLCNRWSSNILQRIICPHCGHIYTINESIEITVTENCEDTVTTHCKGCGKLLEIHAIYTEYRIFTKKVEDNE